jgi:hypothetical protein
MRMAGAGSEPDEHHGAPFTVAQAPPAHGPGGGYADSFLRPESGSVSYASIKAVRVKFAGTDYVRPERTPFVLGDWVLGALRLRGRHAKGEHPMFEGLLNQHLQVVPGGPPWAEFDIPVWSPPDQQLWPDEPPGFEDLPEADRCCFAKLKSHIGAYAPYYRRWIWMNTDRQAWAEQLENISLSGIGNLLDVVEHRPIEVIGEYVAFMCTYPPWSRLILDSLDRQRADVPEDERLVTLPTRGIFAEAKLGHCNASEEIDNTRFWDWQQSPIPHFATQIMPVQAVTPKPEQQNVTPTPFPSSLVNIVNPPTAPDPTGLGAALTAISTPNIFRDMSGRAEVADLLKKLSDNTIGIAEAANRAREIQSKYGGGATGGGGGGTTGGLGTGSPRATPTQPSAVNRDLHDLQPVLQRAQDRGLMTPQTAKSVYEAKAREELGG